MIGKRALITLLGMSLSLVVLSSWLKLPMGFAQTEQAAKQQVLAGSDLENIQRRLDQITENHQKLLKAIEDIKADLAIIKVRVTN